MSLRQTSATALDVEALQGQIGDLPDVRAARVVTNQSGRITEIHVVADGDKSAKNIVRDVQTLAQARFGTAIDHRIVSVVQFGGETIPDPEPEDRRLTLTSVGWTTDGARGTCRVELEGAGGLVAGEASGAATSVSRVRLPALAATRALESAEVVTDTLDVSDVVMTEVGGRRVAVVMLVVLTGYGEETLVGSALVRGDESEAVARAILDAFNRRIS